MTTPIIQRTVSPRSIPMPGAEGGPCQDACNHRECATGRTIAESICILCGYQIGYECNFYQDTARQLMHATCLNEDIERRR